MLLLSVFLVRELHRPLSSLHQTYSVRLETQRHSLLHFISFASFPCFPCLAVCRLRSMHHFIPPLIIPTGSLTHSFLPSSLLRFYFYDVYFFMLRSEQCTSFDFWDRGYNSPFSSSLLVLSRQTYSPTQWCDVRLLDLNTNNGITFDSPSQHYPDSSAELLQTNISSFLTRVQSPGFKCSQMSQSTTALQLC